MFEHNDSCINCNMSDSDDYESCWCDKIGGKIWWYSTGGCEDFYNIKNNYHPKNIPHKYKKNNKLNHYQRKLITKIKLKKIYKTGSYFISYNEEEDRYSRFYLSGCRGYAKWCSKRKVRNRNDFSLKGSGYKKIFDYWWSIF